MKKSIESLEEELSFLKKEWPALRVGRLLLLLFITAGVLGLFGSGLFSEKTIESRVSTVQYDRYLRHSTESKIVIEIKVPLVDSSIYFNSDYLKRVKIEKVQPEPDAMVIEDDRVRFRFNSGEAGQVIFHVTPSSGNGSQVLEIGMGGQKQTLYQFIYF